MTPTYTCKEAYQAAVRRAFAEAASSVKHGENALAAQRRIVGCVERGAARHHGSIAIVLHGLILSLLVARLRGQSQVDFAAWRGLPMPALALVDPATWELVAPFRSPAELQAGEGDCETK